MQSSANILSQLKASRQADANRRASAKGIVTPENVAGKYDETLAKIATPDGPITAAHLEAYRRSMEGFKKRTQGGLITRFFKGGFSGGITAKQALATSSNDRKQRAASQIHRFSPVRRSNSGIVHYRVDSKSNPKGYVVSIEYLAFPAAVMAGLQADSLKMAKTCIQGRLKIDCTCPDHTFMYRYMATVGGYNTGRMETGFPKIKNRQLQGMCCKHVIRVMWGITHSAWVERDIQAWLEFYRKGVFAKELDTTAKERQAIERADVSMTLAQKQGMFAAVIARAKQVAKEATNSAQGVDARAHISRMAGFMLAAGAIGRAAADAIMHKTGGS